MDMNGGVYSTTNYDCLIYKSTCSHLQVYMQFYKRQ